MLGARSEDFCTAVALSLTGRDGWHVSFYRRSVTRDESSCYYSGYMAVRAISALFVLAIVLLGTLEGVGSPSASEHAAPPSTSSAQRATSAQDSPNGLSQSSVIKPEQPAQIRHTRGSVNVGDTIGELTVTSVKVRPHQKDLTVRFSGEMAVRGSYSVGEFGAVQFDLHKSNNPQLPRFLFQDNDRAEVTLCITNEAFAGQKLSAATGERTILIKNYVLNFVLGPEIWTCDAAELVRAI